MKTLRFLLLVVATTGFVYAQNSSPAFEVASVKPNKSRPTSPESRSLGCRGTDGSSPGTTIPLGRCISRFEPLRLLIALAYDIPPASMYPYQGEILSGPGWIDSEI